MSERVRERPLEKLLGRESERSAGREEAVERLQRGEEPVGLCRPGQRLGRLPAESIRRIHLNDGIERDFGFGSGSHQSGGDEFYIGRLCNFIKRSGKLFYGCYECK